MADSWKLMVPRYYVHLLGWVGIYISQDATESVKAHPFPSRSLVWAEKQSMYLILSNLSSLQPFTGIDKSLQFWRLDCPD